eukprot:3933708-Rhodomonas_salina.2
MSCALPFATSDRAPGPPPFSFETICQQHAKHNSRSKKLRTSSYTPARDARTGHWGGCAYAWTDALLMCNPGQGIA